MDVLSAPISPEDLAALVLVSDARIAPDGTRVTHPERRMDLVADRYRAALMVVPADGSEDPIVLTVGADDAASLRWWPDSWFDAHP